MDYIPITIVYVYVYVNVNVNVYVYVYVYVFVYVYVYVYVYLFIYIGFSRRFVGFPTNDEQDSKVIISSGETHDGLNFEVSPILRQTPIEFGD